MKCTVILSLALFLAVLRVGSCSSRLYPKFYNEESRDDQNLRDRMRAESWFSDAVHSVGNWANKAASDVGKATKNAANTLVDAGKTAVKYAKKGCHYVNMVPFKQLVYETSQDLRAQGVEDIDEDQVMAALGALKGGCTAVSMLRKK